MRRIFAQSRKELTQIIRDWRTLTLALVLPLVLLLLMSSALSLTVSDLPIIVQDLDDSPASRDFIDAFRASITFHVVAWPANKQPEQAFTSNAADAALIIPEHFGRDMARGLDSPVQLLVDASDANTAKLIAGYSARSPAPSNTIQPVRLRPSPCRRRSGSGTTPAVRPRNSLHRAYLSSGCPCFRHYWRRWPWRRKGSRRPFSRFMFPASRRMSSCSERSWRSWAWQWRNVCSCLSRCSHTSA